MEKTFGDDAQAYFNLLNNMSYGKPDSIAGIANLKPAYFVTPKIAVGAIQPLHGSALDIIKLLPLYKC